MAKSSRNTIKLKIKTVPPPADPELGVRTGNGIALSWFETGDLEYTLKMDHWLNDEAYLEEIDLTREEYITLKTQIAKMRGIKAKPKDVGLALK